MAKKYEIGAGSRCAVGLQSAYGTAATSVDTLLNMRSESIGVSVTKTAEDNLIQNKTTAGVDLDSVSVAGNINTYLRPEFADWLFEATLGKASSGVYTLADPDDDIPFSTVVVERGTDAKQYADMAVASLTLTCNAQKTVEASISFIGVKEEDADEGWDEDIADFVKKSYKCTSAYLKLGAAPASGTDTRESLPVETLSLTIGNGLSEGPRTYLSTIYADEPSRGTRSVALQFTLPVEVTSSKGYKNLKSKVESNEYVAFELQFDNGTSGETIKVVLPNVSLTSSSANVGGAGIINGSISGAAVQVGSTEPITITVSHPSAE